MARLPFPRSQVYAFFGPRNYPPDPDHKGIDFGYGMSVGLAVPCAAAGVVIGSGHGSQINFWKEVDHGGGWTTRYHMLGSSNGPGVGDTVAEGQTIGFVGPQSGTSSGVHLHFEVHNKNLPSKPIYGTAVDPLTNINNFGNGSVPNPTEEEKLTRGFAVYANTATNQWAVGGPGTWQVLSGAETGLYSTIYGERVALNDADYQGVARLCRSGKISDVRVYANVTTNVWALGGPGVWFIIPAGQGTLFENLFGEKTVLTDAQFQQLRAALV
ncbi:M23 family metallopeptidase [Mycetocola saprophilus]|uniref:M23 family metallopeptidase n=1 Tax=Mycetocola saprophilus TaxID=76636 RepID=UPI00068FABF6|nr:M23 family metallopeptidase [Mycetocola saprophilus]